MPICPNCKEEIDELLAYSEIVQTLQLNVNGNPDYYDESYIEGYTGFECPECHDKIFNTENKAIEFLKNKDELQKIVAEKLKKDENTKPTI